MKTRICAALLLAAFLLAAGAIVQRIVDQGGGGVAHPGGERASPAVDHSGEPLDLAPDADSRRARAERDEVLVRAHAIEIGMSEGAAKRSIGAPNRVNRTVTAYGTHDQWVMPYTSYPIQRVYIENGLVVSWQQ